MDRRTMEWKDWVDWIPLMAKALVFAFLGMGGFEFFKSLLFPTIAIWGSLALSFLFVAIASAILTSRVRRNQGSLQKELMEERRLCLEAEHYLCQLRKKFGLPFTPLGPQALSS